MERIEFGATGGGKTVEPFDKKLNDSFEIIDYLEANGLPARQSRLGKYAKFYERYLSGLCSEEEVRDNLLFVLREMDEWSWIYKGLKIREPDGYMGLLKQAIGGPAFAKEESNNTTPRNIQLELRIGSYFLQADYDISFSGREDLAVVVNGFPVFVECKRLNSPKQVLKRSREAVKQLKNRYKSNRGPSYGLVVLDVSKVIHPKQGIATGVNEIVARDGIRAQLKEFDLRYDTSGIFSKDRKLISVWMQAIVPTVHEAEKEVAIRFSSLHSIYAREGQRRWHLLQELKRAFEIV